MSDTYDTYEDWEEEAKNSPLTLVGILVLALTSSAIIGNALYNQPKSAERDMMKRTVKQTTAPQITGTVGSSQLDGSAISKDHAALTLAVQRQLTMAGYYVGPLDGMEGAQTREAVAAYQDANGMTTDGRVTMALYDVLTGRKAAPQRTRTPVVALPQPQNASSDAVKLETMPKSKPRSIKLANQTARSNRVAVPMPAKPQQTNLARGPVPPQSIPVSTHDPMLAKVQEALKTVGYVNLSVDGLMGDRTSTAIADFQRNRGHPVTGKVNDRLLQELMIMGYLDLG
ncbi:peptidoglycan-binding protein [Cohaesibacter sp. CAU 1516]|uniref:peptidoglycan-binding domain-containing protein n=1 Tax=Cohaesibacter sp. CAU 1516 TaxID=2576038 RepID=UPI0014851244|nr:peptidoglycan-binding protein [Cohaesibacter sp. CAU 1516]